MLLQMALFHSFLWLSSIPLYVYAASSLSTHLSMDRCRVRHCNPMDCSLPASSAHGIFQARVLEWVAISFPTQGTNQSLLRWRQTLYHLSRQGSHQCVLRLFPCLSYCTWCYCEHWGACIFLNWWSGLFCIYILRSGIAGSYSNPICSFLRNLHTILHSGSTNIHSQ